MRKVVSIHQPNFLPWLGFFNKLVWSDVFVFMDNVQFPNRSWSNRVQILIGGAAAWITAPIDRSHEAGQRIRIDQTRMEATSPWREKMVRTIRMNYAKAPHAAAVMPLVEEVIMNPANDLAGYNIEGVLRIAKELGIGTDHCVRGSTLEVEGQATALLISMTKAMGGTTYMCGGGAAGYQDDDLFASSGLEVAYQGFTPPVYPQLRAPHFVPGLSIVDALFNRGLEGTRELIFQAVPPVCQSGDPADAGVVAAGAEPGRAGT